MTRSLPQTSGVGLVLSCEHASNAIPRRYSGWFQSSEARAALQSHRGSDPKARPFARKLGAAFECTCIEGEVSRLLIDLNRSAHHPDVFSEFSRGLGDAERRSLISRYHEPFRAAVRLQIDAQLALRRRVLHLSVHSFTPVLNGQVRNADVGLLYDPQRHHEARLCKQWARELSAAVSGLRVRRNYPYRGTADGHTTALRRLYDPDTYVGIELELNQASTAACLRQVLSALTVQLRLEQQSV